MINRAICMTLVGLLVFSTFAIGCLGDSEGSSTITVIDMAGRTVEVPEDVERIVGIEAGAVRMIAYLDAMDMLVGVEDVDQVDQPMRPYTIAYNDLLNSLPAIGPIHGGEPELITSVQPDVIFWTYCEAGEANDLQTQTGIPVVAINFGDLADQKDLFYDSLRLMGSIIDKEDRAEEVVDFFDSTLEDLDSRTSDIPEEERPEVYVGGIAYSGPHGITSTNGGYPPFLYCNANNVATSEIGTVYADVDPEAVLEWDPEIVFVDTCSYALVQADLTNASAFGSLSVLQTGEIYKVMPYNWYTTNYGTVLVDAYYVGMTLYPEAFSDVTLEDKAAEIFTFLVGEDVFDEMNANWDAFERMELS